MSRCNSRRPPSNECRTTRVSTTPSGRSITKDLPALAVQPLESALKQLPNDAELLVHLGLTYAKLDEKEGASDAGASAETQNADDRC